MFSPALARIELDRFWVNPGDKIFAMYTFSSTGPSGAPLDIAVVLRPRQGGRAIDCSFIPCLPTVQWPADVYVREGLMPLVIPEDAAQGEYDLLVALRDPIGGRIISVGDRELTQDGYVRAARINVAHPRFVDRREPITIDFLPHPQARREAPANPLVLSNAEVQVILDATTGLPRAFKTASGAQIAGMPWEAGIVVAVHRLDPRASIAREVAPREVSTRSDRAALRFAVEWSGVLVAEFQLVYMLSGSCLSITLEEIVESAGFEMVQVELPALVSITDSDKTSWIAYAEDGGQLAKLSDVRGGRLRATTEWRFSAPVAMVGNGGILAALEVPAYLDTTELTVDNAQKTKIAWLGTTKMLRTSGGPQTPNLPVAQHSLCRLHILSSEDSPVTWLDAAKCIRRNMPSLPTDYYDTRVAYKIFCQCPPNAPVTTFAQAQELISAFAALTDNFPHAVYLVGWQYGGHDTGYPAIDVVNEALGGEAGLRKLMESAAAVNCAVSFHDNYDDAYRDSPDWDDRFIARYPDGTPMKGGWWAGGQSWIIGMANYARERGWNRALRTCDRYRIRETYHIDVLSAEALRPDWNADFPASAFANLMGKYRIIDAFASRGVDVTTEGVSWPFVGKVTWYNALQQMRGDRFGGEVSIPLAQALYRNCARWGGSVGTGEGALRSLYKGCCFGTEITADPGRLEDAVDGFYIIHLPWLLLKDTALESCESADGVDILRYGERAFVKLDWRNTQYEINLDGIEIARNHATFCPFGDHRLAFYSLEPRILSAPLPAGWDSATISARVLSRDGSRAWRVECSDGIVSVDVPARTPVIVYRHQGC